MPLIPVARAVERVVERLLRRDGPPILQPYRGYAEADALVLQGRVLSAVRRDAPEADHSRWTNFKQMVALFLTSEVEGVPVRAGGVTGYSDAEGYVRLRLPRRREHAGWIDVHADLPWTADPPVVMPVLVPGGAARFGVISDIDDTLLHTGAHTLWRNLWTTFTGNALTREVYPDAVELIGALSEAGRNPVFYVSSSPWNLFAFLEKVFDRAGLVPGPMFLRDLGVSDKGLIGAGHGDHKGAAVDRILNGAPELRFWLLGDTGQKDAMVYRDAIRRHSGRIGGVILRDPLGRLGPETRAAIEEITGMGVPVEIAPDFSALPPRVLPAHEPRDSMEAGG